MKAYGCVCTLTLAGSSAGFWPSSVSGAVGTETGSSGDLAFPACPKEAVLTWGLGRLPPADIRNIISMRLRSYHGIKVISLGSKTSLYATVLPYAISFHYVQIIVVMRNNLNM